MHSPAAGFTALGPHFLDSFGLIIYNHYMKTPPSRPVPSPVAGFMVKVFCVPTKLYTTSELTPGPSGSTAVTYRAQNTTPNYS